MNNRNATATWSGFAHQGQVGLLVALRTMQEIDQKEYAQYYLEYENKEDIAIYKLEGTPYYKSVHQVKAYYSEGGSKSKYKKALADFECCGDDYLHTVMEIKDWDTSTTGNPKNVKRYSYSGTKLHCSTEEIEGYLIEALKKVTDDGNDAKCKVLLQRLTYELDQKICQEHRTKKKVDYDIKFSFEDIRDILEKGELSIQETNIYECRRLFYSSFKRKIKSLDITKKHLEQITQDIIEIIYQLPDVEFVQFLKLLNLNEPPKDLEATAILYNAEGLRSVFFDVLLNVERLTPSFLDQSVQYSVPRSSAPLVLTSINQEDDLNEIVENIIENMRQLNVLWEGHQLINRHHTGKLIEHHNTLKNLVIKDELNEDPFNYFSKKGGLIERDKAKEILNNE